ncbi:MAG: HD domain-containing protein [Rickettsiales bacterium]|jgi:HD superfamily phosphohydrolase|nr:HD domain-containing protein [Rickettsiales bacterium]
MIFIDRIYGVLEAEEPVFEKIVLSKPFQRLYGIQMGCWAPGCPFPKSDTRYEHSIGVLMLLRKYGASIEEQISGLIHDVSHTAFSHLSDRLFGGKNSEQTSAYQDSIHDNFVKNSELADIITDAGFDLNQILDESRFKLKEKDLPDLCADRMDYSLRIIPHFKQYGKLLDVDEKELANLFIPTSDGFIMKDLESARIFARAFNQADEEIYSSFAGVFYEAAMKKICSDAIASGILTRQDFFDLEDMQIVRKLALAGVDFSLLYADPMDCRAQSDGDFETEYNKVRRIDPRFMDKDGQIFRLSDIDAEYKKYIQSCPKYVEYKIKRFD